MDATGITSMKRLFGGVEPEDEKMVAKKKSAPKKKVVEEVVEEVVHVKTGPVNQDITITVAVVMLDGTEHVEEFRVANATGCIPKSQLGNAGAILNGMKAGLIQLYGPNHVKE